MILRLGIIWVLLCLAHITEAQYLYKGTITEEKTNRPIAFAVIRFNETDSVVFSDYQGNFSIKLNRNQSFVTVQSPFNQTAELKVDASAKINIVLQTKKFPDFNSATDTKTQVLVKEVIQQLNSRKSNIQEGLSYKSYTKIAFDSDSLNKLKATVNKILKYTLSKVRLQVSNDTHMVLVLESFGNLKTLGDKYYQSSVKANLISGIESKRITAPVSALYGFSLSDAYINISGLRFLSPFAGRPFKRYHFHVIDSVKQNGRTKLLIAFAPEKYNVINRLKGVFLIDELNMQIDFLQLQPALDNGMAMNIAQTIKTDYGQNYAANTSIYYEITNFIGSGTKLKCNLSDIKYSIKPEQNLKPSDFNEIVYDLTPEIKDEDLLGYFKAIRPIPLKPEELKTYSFYDTLGQIKKFERVSDVVAKIYTDKYIPYGKIALKVSDLLRFNIYEGLRPGLGLASANSQSNPFYWSAYAGYGLKDLRFKYKAALGYYIDYDKRLLPFVSASDDLAEPGTSQLTFDRYTLPGESLRRLQLLRLDRVLQREAGIRYKPNRFIITEITINNTDYVPLYSYAYQGVAMASYRFTEFKAAANIQWGAKYLKFEDNLIRVEQPYPEIWIQYTQGFNESFLGGAYSYRKLDTKINYTFETIGLGKTQTQLNLGFISNEVPLAKLFNARGNLRATAIISGNSFETMQYNEFLSSRYAAWFVNHSLERFYIPGLWYYPYLSLVYHTAYGQLDGREKHYDISFKTLDRGFHEMGFIINDLYVIDLIGGLKAKFSFGAFTRLGHYRFRNGNTNNVIKLGFDLNF